MSLPTDHDCTIQLRLFRDPSLLHAKVLGADLGRKVGLVWGVVPAECLMLSFLVMDVLARELCLEVKEY